MIGSNRHLQEGKIRIVWRRSRNCLPIKIQVGCTVLIPAGSPMRIVMDYLPLFLNPGSGTNDGADTALV